jgi:hypothetical protein
MTDTSHSTAPPDRPATVTAGPDERLERSGRWWLFGSFVFCPCHLPLTLGLLAAVFGGTTVGVVVRDHAWVAGTILTGSWVMGRGYLVRVPAPAPRPIGGIVPHPRDQTLNLAPRRSAPGPHKRSPESGHERRATRAGLDDRRPVNRLGARPRRNNVPVGPLRRLV